MSKKQLVVWFDSNGNLLEQAGTFDNMTRYAASNGSKSEEAKDFDTRMEYVSIRTYYRKEPRVLFQDVKNGRKYSMFLDDFNLAVQARRMIDNQIEGTFQFTKKGTGQAIKLLLPKGKP